LPEGTSGPAANSGSCHILADPDRLGPAAAADG